MMMESGYPLVDLALSRRLERTEAAANVAFVESRAVLQPSSGAVWMDVGGAYAMFDGVGSPLTQTFGLGLFSNPPDNELVALERFFLERRADVFHEVSPLVDPSLPARLSARGFAPVEFTSVMFRPATLEVAPDHGRIGVRRIDVDEADAWARVAAEGWSTEAPGLSEFMLDLGSVSARGRNTHCFLAEIEEKPVAAGALSINGDVALLAGASTIPAGRRQGAQRALLAARLQYATERGCVLAMMCAAPGSASQRNAERQGFRIAYTRVKWMLQRKS